MRFSRYLIRTWFVFWYTRLMTATTLFDQVFCVPSALLRTNSVYDKLYSWPQWTYTLLKFEQWLSNRPENWIITTTIRYFPVLFPIILFVPTFIISSLIHPRPFICRNIRSHLPNVVAQRNCEQHFEKPDSVLLSVLKCVCMRKSSLFLFSDPSSAWIAYVGNNGNSSFWALPVSSFCEQSS